MNFIILMTASLIAYAVVFSLAYQYSVNIGWSTPEVMTGSTLVRRRLIGAALGGLALVVCAAFETLFLATWSVRALIMAQAVLMAAAGASDLHRFQLPLPLTLVGMIMAMVTLRVTDTPLIFVVFGLIWSVIIIGAHALLSKGSMQLGDHLSTIWIALAMPVNGMLAIVIGDAVNALYAGVRRLKGRQIAAAGTWLIAATALLALPSYFFWFDRELPTHSAQPIVAVLPSPTAPGPGARSRDVMLLLSTIATEDTAGVALMTDREGRISSAYAAGLRVQRLASIAQLLEPQSITAIGLKDLAVALKAYDVDAVRDASAQLANEREQLRFAASHE